MATESTSHSPPPTRLLVRGVNWLGDAVMSTPALLRLREALPHAHVALLTHEKLAGLWEQHPALDEIIPFAKGESVWQIARRLRAGNFDTALILPNSFRSALEAWLARIPRRFGYATHGRSLLLNHHVLPRADALAMHKRSAAEVRALADGTRAPDADFARRITRPAAHHVHQYLHLAAALGASPVAQAPRLSVTPAEQAHVRAALFGKTEAQAGRPLTWFGLNPGAEYGPAKRWPVENFIAAARELCTRTGCAWVIFGGPADQALAEQIRAAVPGSVSAAGRTTLRELVVALSLCRVVLTNDTGPMHVAAAVGTPVVVPFGSTSPELTGPGLPGDPRHRLLKSEAPCAPCFLRECPIDFRCMKTITVQRVVAAVMEIVTAESDGNASPKFPA
ncbi:lipopolysaccharide heptosyltransferase II [Verrucomicrobiota bacterium]|nr:lipopolysaccharide heptosyltransferase II [Verrucomicrobiota bacterium]